jgi:hypothetical protein
MHDFLAAPLPSCAVGLVQDDQRQYALFALRPRVQIPPHIASAGGGIGFTLLGTPPHEVIHIGFQFPKFATYHVLVNPGSPLIRSVLAALREAGDSIFFATTTGTDVRAYGAAVGQDGWQELIKHRERRLQSTTTISQYNQIVGKFRRRPEPPGQLLDWVCRDQVTYLDCSLDSWELKSRAQ